MSVTKQFRLNKLSLISLSVIAVLYLPPVWCQESDLTQSASLSEILIEPGYRTSLMQARDLKLSAVGARDSIIAEDIADFPDLNLAESLQRIPGVAITREGGEGRQISLRGLGPDFTNVELNGMQVLGNSSSSMDSRDGASRTRAFDFNIFASELFNRVDVYKSYSANLDEGGIGGTVRLFTAKPFDGKRFNAVLTAQLGSNEYTDDASPRLAALISNTWDDRFGALASVAYSKRDTIERGYNTFRWRQRTATNSDPLNPQYSADLDPSVQQLLENGEVWFARGNRYSVWENEQERLGITTALQFRPSGRLSFDVDMLYGELNNSRRELHLATEGSGSTALGFIEDLDVVNNNGDHQAVYGEFSNTPMVTETRLDEADTTFTQLVLSGAWKLNKRINIKGLIGTEKSEYEQPVSDKVYFETAAGVNLITDFKGDAFYAVNTYGFDPADIDNWQVRELDFREDYITSEFDNIKVDIEFEINELSRFLVGASYKVFENSGRILLDDNYLSDPSQITPLNNGVITIGDYASVYSDHPDADWLVADVDAAHDFYGLSGNLTHDNLSAGTEYFIEEDTRAVYLQYEWERELAGKPLRGNFGLRYYDTEIAVKGTLVVGNISQTHDYDGMLPALNLAWDLTDEFIWRASVSENLTRPSLNSLSIAGRVFPLTDASNTVPRVIAGNPALKPFESFNMETSLEWYFDHVGFVTLGVFYKEIENYIINQTEIVPYGETGFPLDLLLAGQDENTLFEYIAPVNTDKTRFKGLEMSFQRDFDFLPVPFNTLGIIANYTYADGEARYRNVQNSGLDQVKRFPGLSEHSGNLTLYYESDNWGARIATAYRSEYISNVEGGLADEDERGFHSTTHVDFSAFYQLSENVKLTLEGINLTDEREEQYSDSSDRAYNTTSSGKSFYLGLSYRF